MKQFLFLFRGGDTQAAQLSPEQMQSYMGKWGEWMQKISQGDESVSGLPLNSKTGKVVHRGGELITDGPFTEGKEIVGGYVLLSAKDLDHAVELSKECPVFEVGGTVEVRQASDI